MDETEDRPRDGRAFSVGFGAPNRWTVDGGTVNLVRPAIPPRPERLRTASGPDIIVDIARAAVIVVDMQNDFLHPEGWFAGKGVDVGGLHAPIPAINRLTAAMREKGVPVVFLNWGLRADALNLPPGAAYAGKRSPAERGYAEEGPRGPSLVRGSWGAQLHDAIEVRDGDIVIDKSRLGGFSDGELDGVLRNLRRHTLFFTGINIDRCVFATLTEATFRGYDAILVEDAVATPSPGHARDTVQFLTDKLYGFRTTVGEILSARAAPDP